MTQLMGISKITTKDLLVYLVINHKEALGLLKELTNEISKKAVIKGKEIYKHRKSEFSILEVSENEFLFHVPSDSNDDGYEVSLGFIPIAYELKRKNKENFIVMGECTCIAYDRFGECKHMVAGILYFENMLAKSDIEDIEFEEIPVEKKSISKNEDGKISKLIFAESVQHLEQEVRYYYGKNSLLQLHKNYIKTFDKNEETKTYCAALKVSGKQQLEVSIVYDGNASLQTNCTCSNKDSTHCQHVLIVCMHIISEPKLHWKTMYLFAKEKILVAHKYNLEKGSAILDKFSFSFNRYNNQAEVVPPKNIIFNPQEIGNFSKALMVENNSIENMQFIKIDFPESVGLYLNCYKQSDFANFEFLAIELKPNKENELAPLVSKVVDAITLQEGKLLPSEVIQVITKLSQSGIVQYAKNNATFPKVYEYGNPFCYFGVQDLKKLKRYSTSLLLAFWQDIATLNHIFYKPFSTNNSPVSRVAISKEPYTLQLNVLENEDTIELQLQIKIIVNDEIIIVEMNGNESGFVCYENTLFAPKQIEDIDIIAQFNGESKLFLKQFKEQLHQQFIIPFLKTHDVLLNGIAYPTNIITAQPSVRIIFKEAKESYLLLQTQFIYDDVIIEENNTNPTVRIVIDNQVLIVQKDLDFEEDCRQKISSLHPMFAGQMQEPAFYISFAEASKDAWFIKAIQQLKAFGLESYSIENLKLFNMNPNQAKWKMKTSSGIDWFDIQIEISFGDETVALSEIRKALLDGLSLVKLKDGTMGMIPKEWRQKFGSLLKIGNMQKNGNLQVSKLHFTIIDALHDEISEEKILQELAEKKNKLYNIDTIKTKVVSKKIKAVLRDYQGHGLQWMQTLDELGWGGCLADDMGLGKTLQTIAFLQYVKEKYKKATSLVVCPTSLIYNWEAELQKFAPTLQYCIHYGGDRKFEEKLFTKFDIIITTYGMVRSDIEQFKTIDWHYVILDESQAIKNPTAQISKVVQLLSAKNKLILSGTPLQNNTFDLYAQFQFINPGLLGSQDFFREEFSNPIDKNNDAEKSALLRQMVFPFLLRRTKEQVAKDLPAKIESTIWCEMDKKQRKVYNDYKDHYRKLVLEKIDEVGMSKAGIYVIEGLLRLRQICDSPLLVKNEKVTTTESIKIKELIRELQENTGTNKVLVFSQFTSMLHLIKEALEAQKISYAYLDGSTTAENRKIAVHDFQTQKNKKVFLISLKAGGVGLNLTSANYVYLVDPWWNPAVEQQAIDRTHRIGQKNKIFAYKMICKDTIEEKIIALQQRKKQLANDLITEDAGFLKKMTREDVQFLFS